MKIKEVEQRTGIGRSNIRYYEREGLLRPARANDSNYRDYTEEDVRQLQRIKVLRMMGVAPTDIKLLATENISLEEVMKKRLEQLEAEVQEAKNLQKVCENVLDNKMDFYSIDEDVFAENPEEWKIPLAGFLIMTLFIGISWAGAINDREEYNRYYAVIVAAKMMNVMGCALINQGRGSHGGRTGYKG